MRKLLQNNPYIDISKTLFSRGTENAFKVHYEDSFFIGLLANMTYSYPTNSKVKNEFSTNKPIYMHPKPVCALTIASTKFTSNAPREIISKRRNL